MRFDDIIAQGQPQSGSLASWLGGEEWLKDLIQNFPDIPVPLSLMDICSRPFILFVFHRYGRLIVVNQFFLFPDGIKSIVIEIQQHPAHVLGNDIHFID